MTCTVSKTGPAGCLELLKAFGLDRRGATAIEYALIAVGLSIAIAAIVPQIGSTVSGMFADVNSGF